MGLELSQELSINCALCGHTIKEEKIQEGALLLNIAAADDYININVCPNCCQEVHEYRNINDVPDKWIDDVATFYMKGIKTEVPEEWLAAKELIKGRFGIMIY